MTIIANFGDMISPGARVGGEPFRAFFVKKKRRNVKVNDLAASIVLDRIYNTAVFFVIAIISIFYIFFNYSFSLKLHAPLLLVFAITSTALVFVGYSLYKTKKGARVLVKFSKFIIKKLSHTRFWAGLKKKYGSQKKIQKYISSQIRQFFKDIDYFIREGWLWTKGTGVSLLYWLAIFLQAFIFFKAVGVQIFFSIVVIIIVISNFAGLIAFLPSGMGITEMIQTGLCVLFAVSIADAAAAVLLIRGNYYLFGMVFGYIVMFVMTKGKAHKVVHEHVKME